MWKSVQELAAQSLLFAFTLLLVLKLDQIVFYSWRKIFSPLWVFHAVVARGRFSLPAPSAPRNRHWAPCHAIMATPLLVAFESLLCVYLESVYVRGYPAVNLKIVFLPLLALQIIVLIDNFRMCRALMPSDDESMSDEAIWETLPHFWVAVSMIFFVAVTVFTPLKLSGDVGAFGWWDLFIILNFGIAECFAFLVCTKWFNPIIHQNSRIREPCSSSATVTYLDQNGVLVVSSTENQNEDQLCGLLEIGDQIMKLPILGFQVLLCMHLEGTPSAARYIPLPIVFSPLFLAQGTAVLFAASKLVERTVMWSGAGAGRYFIFSSIVHSWLAFLQHCSRLLGWWSIDEGSRGDSDYNNFCGYPPDVLKKMSKRDLAEEVWRLKAALCEQTEITKFSQGEIERLKNEKVCKVCYARDISTVLLPCRHHVLCSICCEKCKKCPICRASTEEWLPVYDV